MSPRAVRKGVAQQRDELYALISAASAGLTTEQLVASYADMHGRRLTIRAIQRRLATMVKSGRVLPVRDPADSRRIAYRATVTVGGAPHEHQVQGGGDDEPYVPVSDEGRQLRERIQRPITYRTPVGYQRDFLERYEPGRTWYLPTDLRERLHTRGRTPEDDRPAGTFARDVYGRLLIDLAWASSRLEGNTYDRLDTQNLLEFGQQAEGKDAEETQMILNHKRAIEFLVDDAERVGFDRSTVRILHAILAENLMSNPAHEGAPRTWAVSISGTTFVPTAIPQVIEGQFDMLLAKCRDIPDPFEQAFFAMVHLPYLQPFGDVNKRTSRLAAKIP